MHNLFCRFNRNALGQDPWKFYFYIKILRSYSLYAHKVYRNKDLVGIAMGPGYPMLQEKEK